MESATMPDISRTTVIKGPDFKLEFGTPQQAFCHITKFASFQRDTNTILVLPLWVIKEIHDWYDANKPPFPGNDR